MKIKVLGIIIIRNLKILTTHYYNFQKTLMIKSLMY